MASHNRPYTNKLLNQTDPFNASEPIPVPHALDIEQQSGAPSYHASLSNQQPISPPALSTPLTDDSIIPVASFIDEMAVSTKQWTFGLSWQPTPTQKTGLLDKLLRKKPLMDLDLSCLLLDHKGKIVERVWFKNMRDNAESIRHRGDSINGGDRGDNVNFDNRLDQEQIDIFLEKIPLTVTFVAFILSCYQGQPLASVSDGYCHISDDEGNVITQLDLPKLPQNCKALWVATLAREFDTWQFTAHQQPLNYYQLAKFEQEITQFFAKIQQAKIAAVV